MKCFIRNLTIPIWPIEIIFVLINPKRRLGDFIAATRIDYVDNPESLILTVISKMRYGCELILVGTDALLLTNKISNGSYNINEIRKFLYDGKKSISNFEHIRDLLELNEIKIELVNIDKEQCKYMIVGRKPNV